MNKSLIACLLASSALLVACAGGSLDLKKVGSALGNAYDATRSYTPEEEEAIGQRVMADLLGGAPLVNDPAMQNYVNKVGRWVAMQSDKPNLKWRFGVTDDPHLNSFAAPSGYILITKGLFDKLGSEAELAAVLAHEIIHVTKGHHVRAIKAAAKGGLVMNLAKIGADARGGDGSKLAANAFSGGTEMFVRGFDKQDEFEADIGGMVLAARAGYNPYALPGVLTTMGNINPKDEGVALLFSTHPSPKDRLDKIEASVGDKLERFASGVENTPAFSKLHQQSK